MRTQPGSFSALNRSAALNRAARGVLDLLVIGGGITGAGILRDAALRGLDCLLVERKDFASGTSGKSSCLIHGGLRYLEQRRLDFVRDSLQERNALRQMLPELVQPLRFVYPLYEDGYHSKTALRIGLWIYRAMGGGAIGTRPRIMTRREAAAIEPLLPLRALLGAASFGDCVADDARLTLITLQNAVHHGARAVNYADVIALVHDGGRVCGARIRDRLSGRERTVHARVVVNAAGPWAPDVAELDEQRAGDPPVSLVLSKGTHVALRCRRRKLQQAVVLDAPDGRTVLGIPRGDLLVVGPTETPFAGDLDHVAPEPEEIAYLLRVVRTALPELDAGPDSVVSAWSGVRPLVAGAGAGGPLSLGSLSRSHRISEGSSGLISVTGGKLTIYRRMAEQTLDLVATRLAAMGHAAAHPRCRTAEVPLRESVPVPEDLLAQAQAFGLQGKVGLSDASRMIAAYGAGSVLLLQLLREEPDLARPLVWGQPFLRGEVVLAAREEMAVTVADYLVRRSRLSRATPDQARSLAEDVAELLGRVLPWTAEQRRFEAARYEEEAARCWSRQVACAV